ncbi:4-hydroxy-tetrahydrodipicolinate synthase [Kitasatospora sp. MAP12-15]|uniref:4-hydroxy-tetrahydrodipicolinate synthase family protein n=1 Tax=unclassified Kitasatospora TaxID=2633591 RepID=UPI002475FAFC|nr:4-hydroxy-tetrahydrodipicolinate synthase [Kitasatospora sp. MAP12-44]MDH6109981.1 4-hydroxy-tetrahydrodipicolinate synthase [Kitasatospora sp. MAP12-44]
MHPYLHGIHIPLITPFTADGAFDPEALEALAHGVLDDGAAGLVVLGTTGEPATLDEAEKLAVTEICARVCEERGAVLTVGAGGNDTRGAVRALQELKRWPRTGAALSIVPHFTRPSEAGVLAHFTELAAHSPVPLIVYHIPYRTGQQLGADTLRRLAELPGIAGVKYAPGVLDQDAMAFLGELPADFAVLVGEDALLSPLLALGASGGILASAHLCTARFVELYEAWQAGELAHARALGHRLARLSATLFAEPNPTVIKGVLHAQGRIPSAAVRLPLLPAGPAAVATALAAAASLP